MNPKGYCPKRKTQVSKIPPALFLFPVAALGPSVWAQTADNVFNATELLCVYEYFKQAGPDGVRGLVTCNPDEPFTDFFFLDSQWFLAIGDAPGCDCDFDLDGLTGCEEVALCLNTGGNDTDGDCLSDGLEIALGLNPLESDTDGNGTPDGEEDLDMDGILEKDEDFDQDALTNCQEAMLEINPMAVDSDGDGFPDGAEVEVLTGTLISDPGDSESVPKLLVASAPPVTNVLPSSSQEGISILGFNTIVSSPPTSVAIPVSDLDPGLFDFNVTVSAPPSTVTLPSSDLPEGVAFNTAVSLPPATVTLTNSEADVGLPYNTTISSPSTTVHLPTSKIAKLSQ
jgi:hypothetical protein